MADETLEEKRRRRQAYRGYVTRVAGQIRTIIDADGAQPSPDVQETVQTYLEQLEERFKKIDEVNCQILRLIQDEEAYLAEADAQEEADDVRIPIRRKVRNFLGASQPPPTQMLVVPETPQPSSVQLPRVSIPPFDGKLTESQSFFESYEVAVHGARGLPDVHKFVHLKSLLRGKAADAIAGMAVTNENYPIAYDLLKTRFGKPEAIVSSILNELLTVEKVTSSEDITRLRAILDRIEKHVRCLLALGTHSSTYSGMLMPVLLSRVPRDLEVAWHETEPGLASTVEDFVAFLKKKVESREKSLYLRQDAKTADRSAPSSLGCRPKSGHSSSALALLNVAHKNLDSKRKGCIFCEEDHRPIDCKMDLAKRNEVAIKKGLCFNCLCRNHRTFGCPLKTSCQMCGNRHHTALCQTAEKEKTSSRKEVLTFINMIPGDVLLQTASVFVRHGDNQKRKVLCLLDTGCQRSVISESLAGILGLPVISKEFVAFSGIGGAESEPFWRKTRTVWIRGTFPGSEKIEIKTLDKMKICQAPPATRNKFVEQLKKKKIQLADDRFVEISDRTQEIELLIGADHYYQIVETGVIDGGNGLVAVKSKLGWLLSGPTHHTTTGGRDNSISMLTKVAGPGYGEDAEVLAKFWELEHLGILDTSEDQDNETLFRRLQDQIVQKEDGRYVVPIPWNGNKDRLPTNRAMAENRLKSLLTRLSKTPDLLLEYDKQIQDFVKDGLISTSSNSPTGVVNFLPHQAVIRNDKKTSRLRIVFDASAKKTGQPSLNDCVETGENLYPELLAVLLRFRQQPIAWIGDVEKAFLQVELHPHDRSAVQFLWIDDVSKPLEANLVPFQWNRVAFGISCSPFLLGATFKKQYLKFESQFPETVQTMRLNTYVDDLLGGSSSLEDALTTIEEVQTICQDMQMKMGKWQTNDPELRRRLNGEDILPPNGVLASILVGGESSKALGLGWSPDEDVFQFNPEPILKALTEIAEPITKRGTLQIAQKLFDPVGFLGPVVIVAKILFQDLWRLELRWDDPLPQNLISTWTTFIMGLADLRQIKIPRHYGPQTYEKKEIHTFCDASKMAYGAVSYARFVLKDGTSHITLIGSKTRVAPLKTLTIPRLELMAALLGARLSDYIKDALTSDWNFHFWTDSTVAIHWIRGEPTRFTPWVRNRVEEIQTRSRHVKGLENWRHCPGIDNPADLASRGVTVKQLIDSPLWWKGPPWLSDDQTRWPDKMEARQLTLEEIESFQLEIKRNVTAAVAVTARIRPVLNWRKFSDLKKTLTTVAWMMRYIRSLSSRVRARLGMPEIETPRPSEALMDVKLQEQVVKIPRLSGQEISSAELTVIRAVQKEVFPEEYDRLQRSQTVHKMSSIIQLRPTFDAKLQLIRVSGRVGASFENLDEEMPPLLPHDHAVVSLLIDAAHKKLCHMGATTVLTDIRRRYWIVRARQAVRKAIPGKCLSCRRTHSRAFGEEPARLPVERVLEADPFEVAGVDYFGPLFVKSYGNDKKEEKVWVLLVTCAVTRAVICELVRDMTASSFVLALRRVMASYDIRVIHSDNAKTFHRASNYLLHLGNDKFVNDYLAENQVKWKFSASRAPWWGGYWERMVKTVKDLLKKTLFRSKLNFEELRTLLREVDRSVNSRPLTYFDGEEMEPITPDLLISGRRRPRSSQRSEAADADVDSAESNQPSIRRRERHRLALLNRWWTRWTEEYLHDLDRFHCPKQGGSRKVRVGDVVLIHDDNKRLLWRQGLITRLFSGEGDLVRAVELKTSTGFITRPVQRLYPLEINLEDDTSPDPEQIPTDDPAEEDDQTETDVPVSEVEPPAAEGPTGEYVKTGTAVLTRSGRGVKRPARFL